MTTFLAHLAGALGQRVWILANAAPRWRYLAAGEAMPWYRSARIFRQSRLGDWAGAMARIAAALAAEAHANRGTVVPPAVRTVEFLPELIEWAGATRLQFRLP